MSVKESRPICKADREVGQVSGDCDSGDLLCLSVRMEHKSDRRTGCGRLALCSFVERSRTGAPVLLSVTSRFHTFRKGCLADSSSCANSELADGVSWQGYAPRE